VTVFTHNFAGWTEGATITANTGTGSGDQLPRVIKGSGATITATSAAAMNGAVRGATLTSAASINVSLGFMPYTTFNALACSGHLKTDSIPTVDNQRLWQPYRGAGSSSAPRIIALAVGALRFLDAAGGTIATTANQTLAQWQAGFKIQMYLVTGTTTANGVLQCKITRLSDAAVIMDTGVVAGNAQIDGFQGFEAGKISAATAWPGTVHLGNLSMDNAATGLIEPASTNSPPTSGISAGVSTVEPGESFVVTLTEADDVAVTTRTFRQVSGPTATVSGSGLTRTITAPATLAGGAMVFGYKTGDVGGLESVEATVSVTVLPASRRLVTVGGATPTLVPMLRRIVT